LKVLDHAGLLFDEPPGGSEVLFNQSFDVTMIIGRRTAKANTGAI